MPAELDDRGLLDGQPTVHWPLPSGRIVFVKLSYLLRDPPGAWAAYREIVEEALEQEGGDD